MDRKILFRPSVLRSFSNFIFFSHTTAEQQDANTSTADKMVGLARYFQISAESLYYDLLVELSWGAGSFEMPYASFEQ